jgi:pyruvate kinase
MEVAYMRKTKIVCTIGPSIDTEDRIQNLILAGMDVARLNLSHGSREDHLRRLKMIRAVSKKIERNVGILFDTRGPEVRTGELKEEFVQLEEGENFVLTTENITGDKHRVSVTYSELHNDLDPGNIILIDDGLITLEVLDIQNRDIECKVIHGGELRSYKGLNIPGSRINLPAVGEQDRIDIELALENEVNFLAASFARSAEDILEIRKLVENKGGNIMIIAKIESREGVENYDSILTVSDGVMVARGDLGVEIPTEEVPLLQKQFIRKCNRLGKPVITATQMLDSMIRNPRPTRAEASDVANAIFDGTDAIMLSGETAIGKFPVESVKMMSKIAVHTEGGLGYKKILEDMRPMIKKTITDAISYATCHTAYELGANAIITATQSGQTARMVSKYKPKAPIIAVSSRQQIANQLTLTWGVQAVICPPVRSTDEMFNNAIQAAMDAGLVKNGDLVVITAGVPVGIAGTTNLLRVETVGDIIVKGTGVGKKAASGPAFIARTARDLEKIEEGQVLITVCTDLSSMAAIKKAAAIITEEGGLTSHAAIVAVNLSIPTVVGVKDALSLIKNGELITVDAIRGLIYRGEANVL